MDPLRSELGINRARTPSNELLTGPQALGTVLGTSQTARPLVRLITCVLRSPYVTVDPSQPNVQPVETGDPIDAPPDRLAIAHVTSPQPVKLLLPPHSHTHTHDREPFVSHLPRRVPVFFGLLQCTRNKGANVKNPHHPIGPYVSVFISWVE